MAPYDPILDYCGIVIQFGYLLPRHNPNPNPNPNPNTNTNTNTNTRVVLFLKDINPPKPDQYNTCMLIAFLQQLLTFDG